MGALKYCCLGLCLAFSAAAEPWTIERALEQALAHNPDARAAMKKRH